jgi:hypothetical protein
MDKLVVILVAFVWGGVEIYSSRRPERGDTYPCSVSNRRGLLVPVTVGFVWRIRVEEAALRARFCLTGLVLVVIAAILLRRAAATDRISTTGVPGTGRIMGLRQTGVLVNGQPQVEMDLLVAVPGRTPYRAKAKEIVPLIMLNRLQGTLAVRVDPARPQAVVVQWDQPNVGPTSPGAESGSA